MKDALIVSSILKKQQNWLPIEARVQLLQVPALYRRRQFLVLYELGSNNKMQVTITTLYPL